MSLLSVFLKPFLVISPIVSVTKVKIHLRIRSHEKFYTYIFIIGCGDGEEVIKLDQTSRTSRWFNARFLTLSYVSIKQFKPTWKKFSNQRKRYTSYLLFLSAVSACFLSFKWIFFKKTNRFGSHFNIKTVLLFSKMLIAFTAVFKRETKISITGGKVHIKSSTL